MVKIKQDKKVLTVAQKTEVARLEKELDKLYERLAGDLGNTALNKDIRCLELKIICITGEKTIDY